MLEFNIFQNYRIRTKRALYMILILFSFFNSIDKFLLAQEKDFNDLSAKEIQYSKKIKSFKSDYLLGPGDKILMQISGIDIYNNLYAIDTEGFLNLPEIDKVYASENNLLSPKISIIIPTLSSSYDILLI